MDEDEKVCFDCIGCCKKRKCCLCTVYLLVILDVFAMVYFVVILIEWFLHMCKQHPGEDNRKVARRYTINICLSYWAQLIAVFLKALAGLRWLCDRSRTKYIRYYRLALTLSFSMIFFNIEASLLTLTAGEYEYMMGSIFVIIMCAIAILIVESHMRYIDEVHFAKTELIKDKQILKRYITTLQRSETLERIKEEKDAQAEFIFSE